MASLLRSPGQFCRLLLLFFAAALSFAPGTQAQTPWLVRNPAATSSTPPGYVAQHTRVMQPGVVWQLLAQQGTSGVNSLMRTADGTTWEFEQVSGTTGYSASCIAPLSATMACVTQYGFGTNGGGEILRTTDGGTTWRKVSTSAQFARPNGFAAWVHFFSSTEGVAVGDPNPSTWEVLRTTDAGLSWSRVPGSSLPAPLDAQEYTYPHSFCTLGNTVWMGTQHGSSAAPQATRVLKSTDRGLTWTASATTLLAGYIEGLAFSSPLVGIAHRGTTLIRTTDGGLTWTSVNLNGNQQPGGRFYGDGVAAVPGTNTLVSVGSARAVGGGGLSDYGSSASTDGGITWQDLDRGQTKYQTVHFLDARTGYAGSSTDSNTGEGGIYEASPAILTAVGGVLAARSATSPLSIGLSPNPVTEGRCVLSLPSRPGAEPAVASLLNSLGQPVRTLPRLPPGAAPAEMAFSTAGLPPGLYMLRVQLTRDTPPLLRPLVIE